MMKVYRKITLLGWQWYLDDGLTETPITKRQADNLIFNAKLSKIAKALPKVDKGTHDDCL